MNLLVLSPHRGDAAFSLGLAMPQWLAQRHRVTILNIFTRSLHAPYSDADTVHENDRLAYISSIRRKEDEQLLKAIPGLTMVDLNMKDAPIRLRTEPTQDASIPKIQKALAKLAAEPRAFNALLLPLAVIDLADRRVVRDAALAYVEEQQPGLACAFYEDFPATTGAEIEVDAGLQVVVYPGKAPDAAVWKRRVSLLYASQIEAADADALAALATRLGGERVWGNAAWVAAGI